MPDSKLVLPEHEADVVHAMMIVANKHDLLVEVVLSFANICTEKKPKSVSDYAEFSFLDIGEWVK
jgi:hypothetical protein